MCYLTFLELQLLYIIQSIMLSYAFLFVLWWKTTSFLWARIPYKIYVKANLRIIALHPFIEWKLIIQCNSSIQLPEVCTISSQVKTFFQMIKVRGQSKIRWSRDSSTILHKLHLLSWINLNRHGLSLVASF